MVSIRHFNKFNAKYTEFRSFSHNFLKHFRNTLRISNRPVIVSQVIIVPPRIPDCTGDFELNNCSNSCLRPSCIGQLEGPHACQLACTSLCVCKGDLLFDDCSKGCVPFHCCPSLCELQKCQKYNDNNQ